MDFLKDLNPQQLNAVTAPLGPVLVLAGAGSGKTRALTYRIAYLIKVGQFTPEQILAVTFTNKAAGEMKERVQQLLNSDAAPAMGTFHSICAKILRKEIYNIKPFTAGFTIFDTDDSTRALKEITRSMDLEKEYSPSYARALVSSIKNKQIPLDTIEDQRILQIYQSYQRLLVELNALDFDDLLLFTVVLFREHPKVLAKYQGFWPYVLVDEYQDTNNLQYEMIRLLIGKTRNVFAVGDDAQSIYGFRGANFENILNFEKDFPDAKVYTLDQNYRSTQNILAAANAVIKLSSQQKEKNLWTKNQEGMKLVHYTAIDEVAEAMFVAGEIMKLSGATATSEPTYVPEFETPFFDKMLARSPRARPILNFSALKNVAVLYRTNAQSRVLEEIMLRFGIPYHLVGAVRFYERREIKDLLSFLRLVINSKDIISLTRVINIPPRGLGDKSIELIKSGNLESLTPRARTSWQTFQVKMESIRKSQADIKLVDIIRVIIEKFDLEEYYRDGTKEGDERFENIKELLTVAAKFNHLPWEEALTEFLSEIALYSDTDEVGSINGITLMTLHQAKGLEYDTVFITGLEEGILPHMRSLEPGGDLAEEIRLAYVGITRARKKLYLLNTYTRRIFGASYNLKPSRILKTIPEELIEKKESWE